MINKECKENCICKTCMTNISNDIAECMGCDWCLEEGYSELDDHSSCDRYKSLNSLKFKKWVKT